MGKMALIFIAFTLSACIGQNKNGNKLDTTDETQIRKMIDDYNDAWLRNDSSTILNLFDENAILIPSGLNPIMGKKQIINFWWPNDSSVTKINDYKITVLDIDGSGNLAYTYETGKLSWSYEKADFKMSKNQQSHEITIFKKNGGRWKIAKRIWTDLKE